MFCLDSPRSCVFIRVLCCSTRLPACCLAVHPCLHPSRGGILLRMSCFYSFTVCLHVVHSALFLSALRCSCCCSADSSVHRSFLHPFWRTSGIHVHVNTDSTVSSVFSFLSTRSLSSVVFMRFSTIRFPQVSSCPCSRHPAGAARHLRQPGV